MSRPPGVRSPVVGAPVWCVLPPGAERIAHQRSVPDMACALQSRLQGGVSRGLAAASGLPPTDSHPYGGH
jgi:hypothetical protein